MDYHDIPRDEAMRKAEIHARNGWAVHFKFTCEQCGERCVLEEANQLYEYGECCQCGHKTKLDMVGFMLVRPLPKPVHTVVIYNN